MVRTDDGSALDPIPPQVPFQMCPIRASLGSLGRKWALLVLREIAFYRRVTFGRILKNNPGLTPRVLSMRLRDLRGEGIIERVVDPDVRYRLSPNGADIIPILAGFIQYGIRHKAALVFKDEAPREIGNVFPGRQRVLLGRLARYANEAEPDG